MPYIDEDSGKTERQCIDAALQCLLRGPAVASLVAEEVWPEVPGPWVGSISRRMTYRAQMLLGRMRKAGLVTPKYRTDATLWHILHAGRCRAQVVRSKPAT